MHYKLKKHSAFLLVIGLMLMISQNTHARILFVDDVFENDSEMYEIGTDDDASVTPLTLQFGGINSESITWDTSQFNVSDDLNVNGGVTVSNTLDANGIVNLGDNGDVVSIDSSSWDISATGIANGLTGITSSGSIDFSSASNIQLSFTDDNQFTLDNDDTGGDVQLIFGNSNNKQLFWDQSEAAFVLNDQVQVQGSLTASGDAFAQQNRFLPQVISADTTDSVISGAGFINAKTVPIPGGTLGTTNSLRATALARRTSGGGSARFRLNYGGSVVADMSGANGNNPAHIQFYIMAKGTGNQRGYTDHSNSGNTGTGTNATTVDSTANQNLILQIDPAGADQWTVDYFLVELIK